MVVLINALYGSYDLSVFDAVNPVSANIGVVTILIFMMIVTIALMVTNSPTVCVL